MLLMDRNYNPFAISNKQAQAHILSGDLPELRCGEFFSHTSGPLTEPLFQFFSHSKELLIMLLTISILGC